MLKRTLNAGVIIRQFLIISVSYFLLSGCAYLLNPERLDIPQGNVITQQQVDQLKQGMTKQQVTTLFGTPLLQDPFHQSRLDYVYHLQNDGETILQYQISLRFSEDSLASWDVNGDTLPE